MRVPWTARRPNQSILKEINPEYSLVNLKIHPTSLKADDGAMKLANMTKTYFGQGGMEIQYNVVDAETLRKAQKNPDEYHNLVVRIAGFSAYFVDMTAEMQEDIIARAEHRV